MKNSKVMFQDFVNKIILPEVEEEIIGISYIVFEHVFGISKTDILAGKAVVISAGLEKRLKEMVYRINQYEPVQYVLGEAFFFGRKFSVNPAVLIPRPETEELVGEVKSHQGLSRSREAVKILDIGTGSGCIPITLALEIQPTEMYGTDVSVEALAVANANAKKLQAKVSFFNHDILRSEIPLEELDVIVSNPPYVTLNEQQQMKKNVVAHEPHLALFVPENDPLVFYKAIVGKAIRALRPGGLLAVEINERFGGEVINLFSAGGFQSVRLIKDLAGKDRIVKGQKAME